MTFEEQRAEAKRLYDRDQPGGNYEADDEAVRKHYLELAAKLHPDFWYWRRNATNPPQTPPASGSPPVPDESRIDE